MGPGGGFDDLLIKFADTESVPGPLPWFGEGAAAKRIEPMGGIPA